MLNKEQWALEEAYLQKTLGVIREEEARARVNSISAEKDVEILRIQAAGDFNNDLFIQEEILLRLKQVIREMTLCAPSPYFARVDFSDATHQNDGTFYIGKYGVVRSDNLKVMVVDWRAPIANLYYAGQIGQTHYETPMGRVDGVLNRKRLFTITDSKLAAAVDADLVSQDELLHRTLSQVSSEKLREVVTTIQSEQNAIIRHPLEKSLLINGVAGSGKTTIALHRIAYLLYAYRETLRPGSMMILAPNPLFLDYIADVLPELGVDRVQQSTFALLCKRLMGKKMPRLLAENTLDTLYEKPELLQEAMLVGRMKGSKRMLTYLDAFLQKEERRLLPKQALKFGPVTLLSEKELETVLFEDLKPFPFQKRILELEKMLKRRVKAAGEEIIAYFEAETARRGEQLLRRLPDGQERRARFVKLYESRDARIKQVKKEMPLFLKKLPEKFVIYDLLESYKAFYEQIPACLSEEEKKDWEILKNYTLARLARGQVEENDLPLLLVLHAALFGHEERLGASHVVLDEAQDFSPLQYALLKRLLPTATLTIVGDMGQGIYAYRGLRSWQEAVDALGGTIERMEIRVSYRNTVEIMELANYVSAKRPYAGQSFAKPVLRHGPKPLLVKTPKKQRSDVLCRLIDGYQSEGFRSIALVMRTAKAAKSLLKELPERYQARYVDAEQGTSMQGVLVLPASCVKGLEFDCVILCDVSKDAYAFADLDARLMYVLLTRPLHRLALLWDKTLSPLLQGADLLVQDGLAGNLNPDESYAIMP